MQRPQMGNAQRGPEQQKSFGNRPYASHWRFGIVVNVRALLMTDDHRNSFTQQNSKDVPQFAPNFTVYVLPPDVVCLYSEDRKFFLHGELFCALASAIGEGGRSFRELVRELEQDFPSDKIHEALKRLIDRRYVVPASRSSGGAVAALLGEPRPVAGDRGAEISRIVVSVFNRSTCRAQRTRGGPERAGRSRRKALPRPDGHAGERLSRSDDWPN